MGYSVLSLDAQVGPFSVSSLSRAGKVRGERDGQSLLGGSRVPVGTVAELRVFLGAHAFLCGDVESQVVRCEREIEAQGYRGFILCSTAEL